MVAKRLRGARRAMSLMLVLSLIAGLMMFTAGSALGIPAGGNNSDSAKLCEDWDNLYRSDSTAFSNWGDCAAYAARGGVIPTLHAFQVACLAAGGTDVDPKGDDGLVDYDYVCTDLGIDINGELFSALYVACPTGWVSVWFDWDTLVVSQAACIV